VTEVRVDAEWQFGEIAKPREHPGDVVDGEAVDQECADAHVLETACGPAEEVALRRAPVLAVDAANAVTTSAEREPNRQPRLKQGLDRVERRRVAHERHRLEQDQIWRLVGEHAAEKLDRPLPLRRVDFFRDCESDGAFFACLGHGRACDSDPEPREVHPVAAFGTAGRRTLGDFRGRKDRPCVRREDVGAGGQVAAVNLVDSFWSAVKRPGAPELRIRAALPGERAQPLKLRRDAAVEDDAPPSGDHLFDVAVGVHPRWNRRGLLISRRQAAPP
jgi:hypothetical protein